MSTIKKVEDLLTSELIDSKSNLEEIKKVAERFSIAITEQVQDLIHTENASSGSSHGIRDQFVPKAEELNILANETHDPIGDNTYTAVKGLVHRYPDRCLLKPVNVCPVYCRFCFRRETVGPSSEVLSKEDLDTAYEYIAAHPEIWEVILTGGDPLILKPHKLSEILKALEAIPHVGVIRIHTRIPVVDSKRITPELISALKINKAVFVALHANHPNEFTEISKKACAAIIDAGIPMLSQTVLLKNINDNPNTMKALLRELVQNRIKPYYLHHGDLAEGTSHFRTSIEAGQKLMKSLRGHISGLCQPTYVLEIPGGHGKIPIGPQYISKKDYTKNELEGINNLPENMSYFLEDHQGNIHVYPPCRHL